MTLHYPIETARYIDRNGEEIIETDTVEYDVEDFDIVCAYIKDFSPEKKIRVICEWSHQTKEWREAFVREIMAKHGDEVEEFFRQRALDGVFAPESDFSGSLGKSIKAD